MHNRFARAVPGAWIALALASAGAAQAQNVTIYGIVDNGLEYLNHTGPGNTSLVRMPNLTASTPSRLGFRGTEDLGNGLKMSFVLESGFTIDSGGLNYGGRLFGRQANVALSNAYGTVTLGRQYNMTLFAVMDADILGPNIYAVSNLDSYLPNTRTDNALGYIGKTGAIAYGATYSLGRDAAGPAGPQATNCGGELSADSSACRQWTVMAKYSGPLLGVSASHDRMNGGPGAQFGLSRSSYSDERSTLNGYTKFGAVKIGAGALHRKNTSAASFTSKLFHLGASYAMNEQVSFDAQLAHLDVARSDNDATLFSARATYAFSRRTAVYLTAGHIDNGGVSAIAVSPGATTLAGAAQSGVMAGLRHAF